MTKAFKFFNVLQIILFALLALGALISAITWAYQAFQLEFLGSIVLGITQYVLFIPLAYGSFSMAFLANLLSIGDVLNYIMLAFTIFIFVWFLCLVIRLCNPRKHYQKMRVFTLIVNILLALIMGYNAYILITNSIFAGIEIILATVFSVMFVVMCVYHLVMNIVGRKQVGEDGFNDMDPNTFFGTNNGAPKMGNYGASAGANFAQPAPPRQTPPAPPARRAPPPPPPRM